MVNEEVNCNKHTSVASPLITMDSISAMTRVRAESTNGRCDATALIDDRGTSGPTGVAPSTGVVTKAPSAGSSAEESRRAVGDGECCFSNCPFFFIFVVDSE